MCVSLHIHTKYTQCTHIYNVNKNFYFAYDQSCDSTKKDNTTQFLKRCMIISVYFSGAGALVSDPADGFSLHASAVAFAGE